jgi:hypothetical protein
VKKDIGLILRSGPKGRVSKDGGSFDGRAKDLNRNTLSTSEG